MTAFEPSHSITHKIYSMTPEKSKFSMESDFKDASTSGHE